MALQIQNKVNYVSLRVLKKHVESLFMQAKIKWLEKRKFVAESGSGHCVVIDGPPEHGGENKGVRPMEMMLMGMGGCAAFDVVNILEKSRQKVTSCEVELGAERAEGVPSPFTKIDMVFVIKGDKLKEAQVQRAVNLSAEQYCSASIMMRAAGVEVTHSYRIES